jgi:hypothetical protein
MPPIRARTATGDEFSFDSREEFCRAVGRGRITAEWEVFHSRAHRWLPVTVHPAFSAPPAAPSRGPVKRTSDLVLIYPDSIPSADRGDVSRPETDPLEVGPMLAPDEIERVLYAPRLSHPQPTVDPAAPRVSGSTQVLPLLEKALPTFSKALRAIS